MSFLRNHRISLSVLGGCLLGSGCATFDPSSRSSPSDETAVVNPVETSDPLEPLNRYFHEFNTQLDWYFVRHLADFYAWITPEFFRLMVANFSNNLGEPFVAANQLLQGRPRRAASDLGRFVVNSTVGVGGLFDPATEWNLLPHEEDFGQTLAVWGIGPGPYLVLPFIGPASTRELPSRVMDSSMQFYILEAVHAGSLLLPVRVVSAVNDRATDDPLARVRERAIDPYIFIREAYLERRRFLIHDGDPPIEALDDFIIEFDDE